jgi:nicotinamide/nicotinate riboside kinase
MSPSGSPPSKTIIIAITGPSSSGKTTLSKYITSLLAKLYSKAPESQKPMLLHQDDFYVPDSQLPQVKLSSGEVAANWDCEDALDTPRLAESLKSLKESGNMPERFESIQHLNDHTLTTAHVSDALRTKHERQLSASLQHLPAATRIVLLDGFLLLPPSILSKVGRYFSGLIMLRITRDAMISRRKARNYATVEGSTWADPEGYIEDVVWPGFARDHAFLFEGGDVAGRVKEKKEVERLCDGLYICIAPFGAQVGQESDIGEMLDWGVHKITKILSTIK